MKLAALTLLLLIFLLPIIQSLASAQAGRIPAMPLRPARERRSARADLCVLARNFSATIRSNRLYSEALSAAVTTAYDACVHGKKVEVGLWALLAGAAMMVFAPFIAPIFAAPGLAGAAAVSSGLAALGGGSLAIGGLGMAGGTMVLGTAGLLAGTMLADPDCAVRAAPAGARQDVYRYVSGSLLFDGTVEVDTTGAPRLTEGTLFAKDGTPLFTGRFSAGVPIAC